MRISFEQRLGGDTAKVSSTFNILEDKDVPAADAQRLAQHSPRVLRVVQDEQEQGHVKALVRKWHFGSVTLMNVNTFGT